MIFLSRLPKALPLSICAAIPLLWSCVANAQLESPNPQLSVRPFRGSDTLHLTAGQSLMLHSESSMKRVFVGNPLVLASFNSSPNDVLITAKEPGVSSLVLWDVHDGNRIYSVNVDLDPTEMQRSVRQMYPGETVQVTSVGDRLELNGVVSSPEISDSITKLGAGYAKQVANSLRVVVPKPQQVELKLQIVEVDRTKLDQFAVNFTSSGKAPVSTSTGAFTSPLNLSIGYLKESINLNIQALSQHSVLQILAEPTLTTLSGQSARFLSGGEFPIPVAQAATSAGSSASSAITIQFRPYGVKVDFLPTVNADGNIRLKVAPEVSTLDYANAVTISGFTIPALSTRRAETEIELKDGQSFILSGLLDHRTIENLGRVPGIANIPVLGAIFRSRNNTHSVTELVFVVTAKIVDPLEAVPDAARPTYVEPFMNPKQFDDEVQRKRDAGKTN
ncbi:MAG: type II and III secretion system protein family protein [Janthinobacterium lividum]